MGCVHGVEVSYLIRPAWMAMLYFKCMIKSFAIKCAPITSINFPPGQPMGISLSTVSKSTEFDKRPSRGGEFEPEGRVFILECT